MRGFAVIDTNGPGGEIVVWQVAYGGDRQAKNVNAVVIDPADAAADKILDSLTWRQLVLTSGGVPLAAQDGWRSHPVEVEAVCDAFLREADVIGSWPDLPRPEWREPDVGSVSASALAAANYLTAAWNFWLRSARRATRQSDPAPPLLPRAVLETLGLEEAPRLVGESS